MRIFVPKESAPGETRVALVPADVAQLATHHAAVTVEPGLGLASGHPDASYQKAGATLAADRHAALATASVVLRLRPPPADDVAALLPGTVHISLLDPFRNPALLEQLAARGVSAIAMELIPRTTRAQAMDALSSQASLAGYAAVILAAAELNRSFPLMMTPAGTIPPARVFVIGAGVAGLQAIATAKRLGARVEAFDTRPGVAEQIASVGARPVQIDLGETAATQGGYARALSPEQLQRQREALQRCCAAADVVITTAQVFGGTAPILVTAAALEGMKPGSVVVDLAIESGGNVEGAIAGQISEHHGVKIIALPHLAARVPAAASQVYSANLAALLAALRDPATGNLVFRADDELTQACLVTHAGRICHPRFAPNQSTAPQP